MHLLPTFRRKSLKLSFQKADHFSSWTIGTEHKQNKKAPPFGRAFSDLCNKLQRDRAAGAFTDAGTAFDAFFFVDLGDAVHDFDSFDRAGGNADAATGAFAVVNFGSHFLFLLRNFQVVLAR